METLKEFKQFVDEITASNSRLYKEEILTKYKDNDNIKYYLNFLFNPYITTGISDKKYNKVINEHHFVNEHTIIEVLNQVVENNTGKDWVIGWLHDYENIYIQDKDLRTLFEKIVTKNIQLGVDTKSINKVIPSLIPEFNVQLANKYFDNPEYVEGKEFALTTKIDGGRIVAIKENGTVTFYTRAGQKYEGLVDLEKELSEISEDNFVLDGEITLLDPGKLVSKEQYKQTMKITRADGEKHGVKMLVFDYLPIDEFISQISKTDYIHRRAELDKLFNNHNFTYFNKLPILYQGTDTRKIIEWLDYNVSHGEEGVMINITNANYEFKRSSNLLKVKKMQDVDLEVIGFEEGSGRNTGKLGAFLVKYKGNIVKVGSGLTDELREEIWRDREIWFGRTIVVKYFEETTNQNGGISLRFPVYIDYREDK